MSFRLARFKSIFAGNHLRIDIGFHLVQLGNFLAIGWRNALPIVKRTIPVSCHGFTNADPWIVVAEDSGIFLVARRVGRDFAILDHILRKRRVIQYNTVFAGQPFVDR